MILLKIYLFVSLILAMILPLVKDKEIHDFSFFIVFGYPILLFIFFFYFIKVILQKVFKQTKYLLPILSLFLFILILTYYTMIGVYIYIIVFTILLLFYRSISDWFIKERLFVQDNFMSLFTFLSLLLWFISIPALISITEINDYE